MVNERVLVTGATGMLGTYLLGRLNEMYDDLLVVEHNSRPKYGKRIYLDLGNCVAVREDLDILKPTIIINLAGLTDVEYCETNPIQADLMNHKLPKELAEYWRRNKTKGSNEPYLLHTSTDFVFDGLQGNYTEENNCNPVNVYGITKLSGESAINSIVSEKNKCLVRFCSLFGLHPKKKTFVIYAIEKLSRGQRIAAAVDQFNSPSYAVNVCDMLVELLENKRFGTFHISGASRLSRYEQATKIANIVGADQSLIEVRTSVEMNWTVKRPRDSSLCVNKAQRILTNKPMEFDDALRSFINEIKKEDYLSF